MVLFGAGDHVPVIPFVDVVGKGLITSPIQIDVSIEKVGVTGGGMVIKTESKLVHAFAFVTATIKVVVDDTVAVGLAMVALFNGPIGIQL